MNIIRKRNTRVVLRAGFILTVLVALYMTIFVNYLLFHSIVEMFSIVIACSLFLIAWNAKEHIDSPAFVHLGTAYLFIAILDLLHTLGYKGMRIFTDYDYYANQLWIATRYLEAATLVLFGLTIELRMRRYRLVFSVYTLITILIVYSIFFSSIFPVCYVEGHGLTPFKIISEYIISGILLTAIAVLYRRRKSFSPEIFRLLNGSLFATIFSEFAFTVYIDNYGFSNLIGHYLKLLSFYLIYRSLVSEGIRNPLHLFSIRLERSTRQLKDANATKDTILAIIAHDLRNSFNSTIGLSGLLLEDINASAECSSDRNLIEAINISSRASAQMLENLLAWARKGSEETDGTIAAVNAAEAARQAYNYCLPQAAFKAVQVRLDLPQSDPVCNSNSDMLQTILRNLLNNAIKFTHRGGSVRLSVAPAENAIQFRVTDNGIGITQDLLDELIEGTNYESSRGTESESGTGLGLQVSIKFLKNMGSALYAKSTPGEGSSFWFSLPLYE